MPLLFLDAGQLTARLDLESPAETPDGQGGASLVWTVTASLWARIEPVSTEPQEIASQKRATITHRIYLRFRSDITPVMRLRKGNRVFAIEALQDPDETSRFLVCLCTEGRL